MTTRAHACRPVSLPFALTAEASICTTLWYDLVISGSFALSFAFRWASLCSMNFNALYASGHEEARRVSEVWRSWQKWPVEASPEQTLQLLKGCFRSSFLLEESAHVLLRSRVVESECAIYLCHETGAVGWWSMAYNERRLGHRLLRAAVFGDGGTRVVWLHDSLYGGVLVRCRRHGWAVDSTDMWLSQIELRS